MLPAETLSAVRSEPEGQRTGGQDSRARVRGQEEKDGKRTGLGGSFPLA